MGAADEKKVPEASADVPETQKPATVPAVASSRVKVVGTSPTAIWLPVRGEVLRLSPGQGIELDEAEVSAVIRDLAAAGKLYVSHL